MNSSSLYTLDRATHLKIVMVAAFTAAAVLIIGESAQFGRSTPAPAAASAVASPVAGSGMVGGLKSPRIPG